MQALGFVHQIQDTVGNNEVYRGIWNKRALTFLLVLERLQGRELGRGACGVRAQIVLGYREVERQVLDVALEKTHTVGAQALGHLGLVLARQREHVVVHVHADHAPRAAYDLSSQITDLAAAAAEIEHHVAGARITRGVAAAIVLLDDFRRQQLEPRRIVVDRTAEFGLGGLSRRGIALAHTLFDVHRDSPGA